MASGHDHLEDRHGDDPVVGHKTSREVDADVRKSLEVRGRFESEPRELLPDLRIGVFVGGAAESVAGREMVGDRGKRYLSTLGDGTVRERVGAKLSDDAHSRR